MTALRNGGRRRRLIPVGVSLVFVVAVDGKNTSFSLSGFVGGPSSLSLSCPRSVAGAAAVPRSVSFSSPFPSSLSLSSSNTSPTTTTTTTTPTASTTSTTTRTETFRDSTTTSQNQQQQEKEASSTWMEKDVDNDGFGTIASLAATALFESDLKRDALGKKSGAQGSSATNWIDDASAFALRAALERVQLHQGQGFLSHDTATTRGLEKYDALLAWQRWMRLVPAPLILDWTRELLQAVERSTALLEKQEHGMNMQQRLACRLILLPSGATLHGSLVEPTGSLVFGKLLYGGVTRYRLLKSSSSTTRPPRRAGEVTVVCEDKNQQDKNNKDNDAQETTWIQFGGTDRKYQAVDMGPAAILEVCLLPRTTQVTAVSTTSHADLFLTRSGGGGGGATNSWCPQDMLVLVDSSQEESQQQPPQQDVSSSSYLLSGQDRNEAFQADFTSRVGGLKPQIDAIVRRVLDGRVVRPADPDESSSSSSSSMLDVTHRRLTNVRLEAQELAALGLTPVRGLLLYGPPGCGKTALAREISRALRARTPKIVAAPELLDRWVGGSEKLVRALFADAEAEWARCGGDESQSALHVIVIDEIDAVFRQRSMAEESGEATRHSAVNQILAKLDGVQAIPNVLLIGLTNRRELLDEALLRPGRLEVQIEIPLPDRQARREILQIHTAQLRQGGRLSAPLCCAIDGERSKTMEEDQDDDDDSGRQVRWWQPWKRQGRFLDLARATRGYSGADIAGLVRCAGSIALARTRRQQQAGSSSSLDGLLITLQDVEQAMKEVKQ